MIKPRAKYIRLIQFTFPLSTYKYCTSFRYNVKKIMDLGSFYDKITFYTCNCGLISLSYNVLEAKYEICFIRCENRSILDVKSMFFYR